MNLANKLTVLRIILILPFVLFMNLKYLQINSVYSVIYSIIALLIFIAAAVTDYFDGKIAREQNMVTDFGKIFDPIADKLLTFAYLLVLVKYSKVLMIVVYVMFLREIIVTAERVYLSKIEVGVLPASKLGKLKTAVLMGTIVILILTDFGALVNTIFLIPSLILTILSGVDYHKFTSKYLYEGGKYGN